MIKLTRAKTVAVNSVFTHHSLQWKNRILPSQGLSTRSGYRNRALTLTRHLHFFSHTFSAHRYKLSGFLANLSSDIS